MPTTAFDRPTLRFLRGDIELALKSVSEKYGIAIATGAISYTAQNASVKLALSVKNAAGETVRKEATDFTRYATYLDLDPTLLGKSFTDRGTTFTLEGYKPKARKNPFLIKNAAGKVYVAPESMIRRGFNLPQRAPLFGSSDLASRL